MEQNTTHLAYKNDLYEIVFQPDGTVTRVVIYPDSRLYDWTEINFMALPLVIRERIQEQVDTLI